jgi:S-adenosylmethionine synthetase
MLIEKISQPYGAFGLEIVEKKGLGHPDTLCDGVSDAVSRGLCRYYMDHFGRIMHHNVDKVLLIGGRSSPRFGGGEVLRPFAVIIGGRATDDVGGERVPVQDIAREEAETFLRATLRHTGDDFIVEPRLGVGSAELRSLAGKALANDTSIGLGFAPLSRLEEDALKIEPLMRSVRGVGEDVKVMGIRKGDVVHFTLAAAIVSGYVKDRGEYEAIKSAVRGEVMKKVEAEWEYATVAVNAADRGDDIYLTVTGTSAEMGDDGETGRGNRFNGLITPGRPMTMEATAGKNPVSHVGKIYNVVADRAARDIAMLDGVEEAYVYLVSRIGAPLDEPQVKAARIYGDARARKVEGIIDYWLESIPRLAEDFIKGKI